MIELDAAKVEGIGPAGKKASYTRREEVERLNQIAVLTRRSPASRHKATVRVRESPFSRHEATVWVRESPAIRHEATVQVRESPTIRNEATIWVKERPPVEILPLSHIDRKLNGHFLYLRICLSYKTVAILY